MAIVDARTQLSTADSGVTDMDDFGAGAATSDTDTKIEGDGSRADTNDSTTVWQGIMWDNGSNRDWTGEHLFFWINHAAAGLVEELVIRFANGSGDWLQTRVATPTFNRAPRFYTGGWVQLVFSADKIFEQHDVADGTPPTLASARYVGIGARLINGVMPKKQDNIFADACWRLPANTPAFRIEGTNGGVPWTWQDVLDWSAAAANGLVQEVNGVLMVNAPFQIGDSASTSSTEFSDATGKIIQFTDDWLIEDDFFKVTLAGNATGTTDIDLGAVVGTGDDRQGAGGGVIRSSRKPFTIDAETDIADLDTVNLYGVTLQGAGITQFSGSTKTDIIGCTFIDCAEIQPNDAEFLNNTIIAPRGRGLEMISTHNIKQCNFIAGSKTQTIETFGTATVSNAGTPADPHTFSHTVASGSTDVALLVLIGFGEGASPTDQIWSVTYNSDEMTKLGVVHNLGTTSLQVSAWILYNPTQGSSQTISVDCEATLTNLAAKAINLRGVPPLSRIRLKGAVGDGATTFNTAITADTEDAFSVDMTYVSVSGPGGTATADGDNTETNDAAVSTEAAFFISEITGNLAGTRQHDWSWTGSADYAQLIILLEEQITEHHVHHPNIGDANVTYEGMKFFGFGAAGAPKWHGENSEANADITIQANEGANPAANEFENTGAPAGTISVENTVNVTINVKDAAGNNVEGAQVYIQKNVPTKFTSGAGNNAGDGDLVVTQTIDSDIGQSSWCNVLDRSLEGAGGLPVLAYRFTSHDGANTFTFPTTVSGSATSTGSGTALVSTTTNFLTADIEEGDTIRNTTDGSFAMVDEITDADNIITTPLQGGTDNTWESGDGFSLHDLATTLISGTDLVDVPLFNGATNASGNAVLQYNYSTDLVIRVRVRHDDDPTTKYIPQTFTGTISSTGFSRDVVLAENTL